MLGRRQRRRANIGTTLGQRLVFAGHTMTDLHVSSGDSNTIRQLMLSLLEQIIMVGPHYFGPASPTVDQH